MLIESNLNQKFWGKALSTAVYLRKRSPTKAVEGKTPFEALYGEKPNVKHLRAFGCASYPLVMKDERKKLDPVAKRCVLVERNSRRKAGMHIMSLKGVYTLDYIM